MKTQDGIWGFMTCALTYNCVKACREIGKENDNEVKGTGNQQDYGMRIYDPRLGRFLSADPLIVQQQKYPELSPYQFASNTPIQAIDLDGLESHIVTISLYENGQVTKISVVSYTDVDGNPFNLDLKKENGDDLTDKDYWIQKIDYEGNVMNEYGSDGADNLIKRVENEKYHKSDKTSNNLVLNRKGLKTPSLKGITINMNVHSANIKGFSYLINPEGSDEHLKTYLGQVSRKINLSEDVYFSIKNTYRKDFLFNIVASGTSKASERETDLPIDNSTEYPEEKVIVTNISQ